jgi:Flp pilus assembly protein TadD
MFKVPTLSLLPGIHGRAAWVLAASLLLAGCQARHASLSGTDAITTGSTTQSSDTGLSFKRTEALSKKWDASKGDAATGFAYADDLSRMGQRESQVTVLTQIAAANQTNSNVLSATGKRLLAAGAFSEAATVLEKAAAVNPQDWQALSALGSTYDQMSRHTEAREKYQQALAIKPDAIATRNNLAMSYALQGELPQAEKMLRELMNSGGEQASRVRQNLALVVGLQGRFEEAKKIASADLPPDEVEANLSYLEQMLAQPDTWKQLQDGNQG